MCVLYTEACVYVPSGCQASAWDSKASVQPPAKAAREGWGWLRASRPLATATGPRQRLLILLGSVPDFPGALSFGTSLPDAVVKPVVVAPGCVMSDTERGGWGRRARIRRAGQCAQVVVGAEGLAEASMLKSPPR
jgi:hypothetical protein